MMQHFIYILIFTEKYTHDLMGETRENSSIYCVHMAGRFLSKIGPSPLEMGPSQ